MMIMMVLRLSDVGDGDDDDDFGLGSTYHEEQEMVLFNLLSMSVSITDNPFGNPDGKAV